MSSLGNFTTLRASYKGALLKCFKANNIDPLLEIRQNETKTIDADQKSALDQAFRDILLETYLEPLNNQSAEDLRNDLQNYVAFCIRTCRNNLTSATMPVILLGDIFDTLTIDKAEIMFEYVESNVNVWKEDMFFAACKNNLLRMCNDLLRKLSRSQNTVFCGRILLFLAKFFPFSERSGLNIISEFNLDNLTEFGNDNDEVMEVDEEKDANEKSVRVDYSLYCKFWALQDFFRNPNQCYSKVQWKMFQSHANCVLSAFNSFKLDDTYQNRREETSEKTHYFAKYLTNQKLLELQLSDAKFRRSILVQMLILFQYLNSTVKFKPDVYELKADQVEWIQKQNELIYKLLTETPPEGRAFAKRMKHILSREEHWNVWKNNGCPEFKRPSGESGGPAKKPKPWLGDLCKDAAENNKYIMGNNEITRLWNLCPNNLEACKQKNRDFLPSLESFFAEAINEYEKFENGTVPDKDRRLSDPNFCWKALRLLEHHQPAYFVHGNNPTTKLSDYIELMIGKMVDESKRANASVINVDDIKSEDKDGEETKDGVDFNNTEENIDKVELDDDDDVNGEDGEADGEGKSAPRCKPVTGDIIDAISKAIGSNWQKLAQKLGYTADECEFFHNEKPDDFNRCKNMMSVWVEDDADATVENVAYILEGLGFNSVAKSISTS